MDFLIKKSMLSLLKMIEFVQKIGLDLTQKYSEFFIYNSDLIALLLAILLDGSVLV